MPEPRSGGIHPAPAIPASRPRAGESIRRSSRKNAPPWLPPSPVPDFPRGLFLPVPRNLRAHPVRHPPLAGLRLRHCLSRRRQPARPARGLGWAHALVALLQRRCRPFRRSLAGLLRAALALLDRLFGHHAARHPLDRPHSLLCRRRGLRQLDHARGPVGALSLHRPRRAGLVRLRLGNAADGDRLPRHLPRPAARCPALSRARRRPTSSSSSSAGSSSASCSAPG